MHEMSLAEGVLAILEDQAKAQAFGRVRTVFLDIGELSHVDPDALAFCFDAVVRGTVADGAVLEINRTPGTAWCHTCGRTVAMARLGDPCPECGGYSLQVTGGDAMRVRELEVD